MYLSIWGHQIRPAIYIICKRQPTPIVLKVYKYYTAVSNQRTDAVPPQAGQPPPCAELLQGNGLRGNRPVDSGTIMSPSGVTDRQTITMSHPPVARGVEASRAACERWELFNEIIDLKRSFNPEYDYARSTRNLQINTTKYEFKRVFLKILLAKQGVFLFFI